MWLIVCACVYVCVLITDRVKHFWAYRAFELVDKRIFIYTYTYIYKNSLYVTKHDNILGVNTLTHTHT